MGHRSFRSRAFWMGSAALSVTLLAAVAPAHAQESGDPTQVEELIITAQRREENIQDVPLSVAAKSGEAIQTIFESGNDITALATRVPGLYAESSNGRVAPRFYIRGLGNTDFDLAASQPVSVIMDEVVLENVTLKSSPIFDIERVEVLRGPQGTLFGRNTPAGIIKFDTIKPSDDYSAQVASSYGTYNTFTLDGGVGGALVEGKVSGRLSLLYQHRDNFIDNDFTMEEDSLGGYSEVAARAQLLFTPTEAFSALANIHFRDMSGDGPGSVFRANILGPGNNRLNGNYDRDTVWLDGGGGDNPQAYDGIGGSLNMQYAFPTMVLTSITAFESTEGFSRADVDGGNMGGPGFIPFPSDTQDSIDLDQFTQEFRLTSMSDGPLAWQAGAFYFNSDFTILTEGFGFPPPTRVRHQNDSYAIFGQGSYAVTDRFRVTAGLRYTEDDKEFTVIGGNPADDRSVSDGQVSWDVSAMYDVTDDFSLYGRIAEGFRAASIQGRDVAFFAPPSVAQAETILSFEAGFKSFLFDRRVRLNGALFTYTVDDPQFTAVGGAGNLVQLLNANEGEAWGFEFDAEFRATENLFFTAGYSYNDTEIKDSNLAVGICAQCTVTDPIQVIAGTPRALVNGNPFPNAPEWIADFTARYSIPMGDDAEFFVSTDWAFQGHTNFFLYESLEFFADDQFEGGLKLGYAKLDGKWEVALFARNITDEHNVKGGIDFNNNTAFVNEPRVIGISLRSRME